MQISLVFGSGAGGLRGSVWEQGPGSPPAGQAKQGALPVTKGRAPGVTPPGGQGSRAKGSRHIRHVQGCSEACDDGRVPAGHPLPLGLHDSARPVLPRPPTISNPPPLISSTKHSSVLERQMGAISQVRAAPLLAPRTCSSGWHGGAVGLRGSLRLGSRGCPFWFCGAGLEVPLGPRTSCGASRWQSLVGLLSVLQEGEAWKQGSRGAGSRASSWQALGPLPVVVGPALCGKASGVPSQAPVTPCSTPTGNVGPAARPLLRACQGPRRPPHHGAATHHGPQEAG